jgi:hypothetical protein
MDQQDKWTEKTQGTSVATFYKNAEYWAHLEAELKQAKADRQQAWRALEYLLSKYNDALASRLLLRVRLLAARLDFRRSRRSRRSNEPLRHV